MKLLFDLFPVILFFLTYKLASGGHANGSCAPIGDGTILSLTQEPIFLATAVAIAATIAQVAWLLLRGKKVDTMLWVSLAIIVVFGGATLYLRDPTFIQWKPSILYWMFAASFLVSANLLDKNLVRTLMSQQIELPEPVWGRLNIAWIAFFVFMGFANLAAVHYFSCDGWVNFKLYGLTGLMLVFMVAQGFWLARYMEVPAASKPEENA
jgi:intracellular septation protein